MRGCLNRFEGSGSEFGKERKVLGWSHLSHPFPLPEAPLLLLHLPKPCPPRDPISAKSLWACLFPINLLVIGYRNQDYSTCSVGYERRNLL